MKKKRVDWKKIGKVTIYILLTLIFIEAVLIITQSTAQQPDVLAPKATPVPEAQGTPTTTPTITPTETPYPKPSYVPTLRALQGEI